MPEDLLIGTEWHGGRLYNRWSCGRLLPVVRGGDGTGGDGGGGDGDAGPGDDGDGDGDGDSGDEADLGEKGKKALAAERTLKAKAEKARKAAEKRAKDAEDKLAKLEGASQSDHEKDLEKARKEAADAATKEATAKANGKILRAEIKVAATGKMANPELAVRLLDLDDFEVDDDGEVDTKAITKAVADLVKDNPGLAPGDGKGKPKPGSGDGGARSKPEGADVTPGTGRLRHAYANSSNK